ncbi:MAG TPA: bifunctional 4-hydroxy-2-oxoglutarate aldolase/2-dehydro-3-deoxy-phosphogluconate aldolase [Pirellulales bacterium]|nr:bifunctional 4-hydroxy-2-oxoglutarate aldolase/2-dehydro-3-deoxy-phosphogluconate aldolase [Pirellulales bacterium]
MSHKSTQLDRIHRTGTIAILRTQHAELLADVTEALVAGGVECVEITFTVPKAHQVLETVANQLGQRALLGAGTVLDPETARIAILAGAEFIVAPNTNIDVIRLCRRYDKIVMPGAFSPTEVLTAWEAGADLVKIFPCDSVGPTHLRALRGPYPHVRMVPSGGVSLETAAAFLEAGAFALGIGTKLVTPHALRDRDLSGIERAARTFIAHLAEIRTALKS